MGAIQGDIPCIQDARPLEERDEGGGVQLPVDGERDGAAVADSALDLGGDTRREDRAGEPCRVVGEDEIEGAVREGEAMGVCATDERREVHEVDPGHFAYSRCVERVDGVAGSRGEAEDAGGVSQEADRGRHGTGRTRQAQRSGGASERMSEA